MTAPIRPLSAFQQSLWSQARKDFEKSLKTFDRAAAKRDGYSDAEIDEDIRQERLRLVDVERGTMAKAVSSTLGSLPVIGRLQAGAIASDKGISIADAMQLVSGESAAFRKDNPRTALGLGLAANLPLMAATGGLGVTAPLRTMAGLSAAQRAMSTESYGESWKDKAVGTSVAAGLAAGVGKFLPLGMSKPVPRTIIGATAGGMLAPEGAENTALGAILGGTLAIRPDITAKYITEAAKKIKLPFRETIADVAETAGARGDVNRALTDRQRIETLVGGRVGDKGGVGRELLDDIAARTRMSGVNYPAALKEAEDTIAAYELAYQRAVSENEKRELAIMLREARDAADEIRQTTAASGGGDFAPSKYNPVSTREAIDRVGETRAEVARRATLTEPQGTTWSEPLPPYIPSTVSARDKRFAEAMRLEAQSAASKEPGFAGLPARPTLEAPERIMPLPPSGGETLAQQRTREALERRSAEATLRDEPVLRSRPTLEEPALLPLKVHPSVAALDDDSVIREVRASVRSFDKFADLPDDSPKLLHEMYKALSDPKMRLGRTIAGGVGERSTNVARTERDAIQTAQSRLLDAMDALSPGYRQAVLAHASASRDIQAYRMGYDAFGTTSATSKTEMTKSPEAVESWVRSLPVAQQQAARENVQRGAQGALRSDLSELPVESPVTGLGSLQTSGNLAERLALTGRGSEIGQAVALARENALRQGALSYHVPGSVGIRLAAKSLGKKPAIETSGIPTMLDEIISDPAAYQRVLARYGRGSDVVRRLNMALGAMSAERNPLRKK